jgi:hypothetical protein
MTTFLCEFCNKSYSSKSNLYTHQKNSKICLKKQGKIKEEQVYDCGFCDKKYTSKIGLSQHYSKCYEKKVEDYKKSIIKEYELLLALKDKEISDLKLENMKLNTLEIKGQQNFKTVELPEGYKLVFTQEDEYIDVLIRLPLEKRV